jgi:DNA-directed RNA polymerase subunit RPC12/RpoP
LLRKKDGHSKIIFSIICYVFAVKNEEESFMAQARCMKCKKQVEVKNPEEVVMKNGMKAVSGVCPECGTKVFKILGKNK